MLKVWCCGRPFSRPGLASRRRRTAIGGGDTCWPAKLVRRTAALLRATLCTVIICRIRMRIANQRRCCRHTSASALAAPETPETHTRTRINHAPGSCSHFHTENKLHRQAAAATATAEKTRPTDCDASTRQRLAYHYSSTCMRVIILKRAHARFAMRSGE